MWRARTKRDQGKFRRIVAEMPAQIDRILALVRDEHPVDEIYRHILTLGNALTQSPPELAYLRIITTGSGETKHLVTLQGSHASAMLALGLRGIAGRALRTGEPQCVAEVARDPDFAPGAPGVKSELAIPLTLGNTTSGVLVFGAPSTQWFTAEDSYWSQILAHLATLAESVDVQRLRDDAAILTGVDSAGLTLKRRFTQVLDDVLGLFAPATGIMAEIMGVVPESRQLVTLVLRPDSSVALHTRLREGEGITGHVVKTGNHFVGNVNRSSGNATHLLSTRSVLAIPITDSADVLTGVLNLESQQADTFTESTLALLDERGLLERIRILMQQTEEPLENARIVDHLLDEAEAQIFTIIDPEDIAGAYFQILQIAAQLTEETDVSGGILLLRDEAQHLASGPEMGAQWIVVAARLGDYSPEPEWSLNERSITRRAIEQHQAQVVVNVAEDPDYKSGGERFASGAELVVPLFDGNRPIGVLDLLTPIPNAFSVQDAANLQRLGMYAVQGIKRANDIATAQRAQAQLTCSLEIQRMIAPLFDSDDVKVEQVREQVIDQILRWTLQNTDSELGQVVLAQQGKANKQPELVVHASMGQLSYDALTRWPVTEGVTGQAYGSGQTQIVAEVHSLPGYLEQFPGAQSEMALPLKRGSSTLGVLDIVSDSKHHYTTDHRQWAEFLADQLVIALNAIDLTLNTQRELMLGNISDSVDDGIDVMRELDLPRLSPKRDELLQYLLDAVVQLTGATTGTILLSVNAYHEDGTIDLEYGQLVEVIEAPRRETNGDLRFFSAAQGLSSEVFRTEKPIVFNSLGTRPPQFFSYADDPKVVQSELAVPIFEGPYIVGVLDLESVKPDTFTDASYQIGVAAGQIASDIIVSAKLRLEEIQSDLLRDFELGILRTVSPDVDAFMCRVLESAARLTDLPDGLGSVLFVRRYPSEGNTLRVDREFTMRFQGGVGTLDQKQATGIFAQDHPPIDYAVFADVLATNESWLALDTRMTDEEALHLPWNMMRSLVCVPLIRPSEDGYAATDETFGVLTMASTLVADFNDADDEVLRLFAQTVTIGLRNIALLHARDDLMQQLTHDFSKALRPLGDQVKNALEPLRQVAMATDLTTAHHGAQQLGGILHSVADLVELTKDLLFWFVDLSDEDAAIAEEPVVPLSVAEIVDDMRSTTNTLADVLTGKDVVWQVPTMPVYVAGSATREGLVKAAIFKFIENALKYGPDHDVIVAITADAQGTTIAVQNTGRQIDLSERAMIFDLGFRGTNSSVAASGNGIGLYQVKRIAHMLNGFVDYTAVGTDQNIFSLRLPALSAPVTGQGE